LYLCQFLSANFVYFFVEFLDTMGLVISQNRGDSFGFPGLPHSKDYGQPGATGEYSYIWDTNQTKRNMFGTTNNQAHFWWNYFILNIPFLADDNSWKRAALDRQVAVSTGVFGLIGNKAIFRRLQTSVQNLGP